MIADAGAKEILKGTINILVMVGNYSLSKCEASEHLSTFNYLAVQIQGRLECN